MVAACDSQLVFLVFFPANDQRSLTYADMSYTRSSVPSIFTLCPPPCAVAPSEVSYPKDATRLSNLFSQRPLPMSPRGDTFNWNQRSFVYVLILPSSNSFVPKILCRNHQGRLLRAHRTTSTQIFEVSWVSAIDIFRSQ